MLVLSRRVGEEVVIGDDVRLRIVAIKGKSVRLAISAPRQIPVHREEVYRLREQFSADHVQPIGTLAAAEPDNMKSFKQTVALATDIDGNLEAWNPASYCRPC